MEDLDTRNAAALEEDSILELFSWQQGHWRGWDYSWDVFDDLDLTTPVCN